MKKLLLGLAKKFKFLPPAQYVKIYYRYYTGKKLDLDNPKEFNEKVQWLKVYYKPPILTQLVDKYAVREFVAERIGPEYLNELLGVYYKVSDVDFDALPQRFVIKGAHGYNFNLLVKDKAQLRLRKARFLMRKWLSRNQYYRGGLEWAYKNVRPKIIAEAYLEQPGKETIDDYKFYCFSGHPKMLQVDIDRGGNHAKAFFDLEWKQLPYTKGSESVKQVDIPRPENFDQMVALAAELARGFPFVRVDFYNIQGRILFGEMTFYPGDGRQEFYPDRFNALVGSYMELPELKGRSAITKYPLE